jgi:hypothetical protein
MSMQISDLDKQLAELKKQWVTADEPTRATLNQQGNALRAQGASEAVANSIAHGNAAGAGGGSNYMAQGYDAQKDLASRTVTQQPVTPPAAATAPVGPPQQVNLSPLMARIGALESIPTTVPVAAAQFQTPEQLIALQRAYLTQLQPLTDVQKQSAREAFGGALTNLQNDWAARGLLATPSAGLSEAGQAQKLAQTMAGIDASAQANAIADALNYANLGLNERGQIFNQQANNRDAAMSQRQAAVAAMAQALGMDIGQSQWAQGTTDQRAANAFAQWFQTQQLNNQTSQFDRNLAESQRQFNAGTALDLSSLFGRAVTPGSDIGAMFGQVQGQAPWQAALAQRQQAQQEAAQRAAQASAGQPSEAQQKVMGLQAVGAKIVDWQSKGVTYEDAIKLMFQQGGLKEIADRSLLPVNDVLNLIDRIYGKKDGTTAMMVMQGYVPQG